MLDPITTSGRQRSIDSHDDGFKDQACCAPLTLPSEQFCQNDIYAFLLSTLKGGLKSRAVKQLLGPLLEVHPSMVELKISGELQNTSECILFNHVVETDSTGAVISESFARSAYELWTIIRQTNMCEATRNRAFGKIIRICSISPAAILQILVCLGSHFDVDRLLTAFLSRGMSFGYHPHPGFDIKSRKFWFFTIKYYYLTTTEKAAYPGQITGPFHENDSSLHICHGSSLIALSFADNSDNNEDDDDNNQLKPYNRTPWRLLILSCSNQAYKRLSTLRDGVEAYLWAINCELTEIRQSLRHLADQISSIAVPSDDFLFNSELRESLLFEDHSYTNSQAYFKALQSLRIVNESIASIITAWKTYNKASILDALQESQTKDDRYGSVRENPGLRSIGKVYGYLAEIERQMEQLAEMIKRNNAKQDEIRALRDGLFNASAVLEARMAVTQGQDIRVLTLISMVFLPASFSTSVFGMQSILPVSTDLQTFAIVIVVVCGITYLLIISLGRIKTRNKKKMGVNASCKTRSIRRFRRYLGSLRKKEKQIDVERCLF